ncbi:protein phosphatase 2C domain-containing protein [Streptomyces gobiensis]|uniref:protein phosphatase 2C domain-containing protein n=1 Tax=Streptomyces gobiensis TaxID=2875706 RepID=UPI001E4F9AC0|nr:protein phosphatase 2C domain-containing protein [Streptomyces gobiensis]UGY93611.1 protein phosphatase 2C domain-containing protein [Streptomyces gobiensis]
MRVELATEPGDPHMPNEDYAGAALPASGLGGTLVVLDGVTPPAGHDGCVHGVPWYVARLGGALLELSGSRRDMTLSQCLSEAIARTSASHASTCDLFHVRTPQATVVMARWNEAVAEHLVLSDSALLIESPDGAVTPVLDPRLDELRPTLRGLPLAERAARIEALRNVADGFHTAAADPAVAERAVTGTTPRTQVRTLAALTDGAARWTEVFRLGDWAALCALLRKEGPDALIARVRAAEAADPAGAGFPRGKPHDDATALLVEL